MKLKFIISFLAILLFANCKNNQIDESVEINNTVKLWTECLNNKNFNALSDIYTDSVIYYGLNKVKKGVIDHKKKALNRHNDFKQTILNNLKITDTINGKKVSFIKSIFFNSKQKSYPSYLVLNKIDDKWEISTESDSITDKNLKKNKIAESVKGKLKGDFNGDKNIEYAWIQNPETLNPGSDEYPLTGSELCKGKCESIIYFTDKNIPAFKISSFGGWIINVGDIDNDGTDEIGFWRNNAPHQAGSMMQLDIYNIKKGTTPLVSTYIKIGLHELKDSEIVTKLSNNKIQIKESHYDSNDFEWVLQNRIVRIR